MQKRNIMNKKLLLSLLFGLLPFLMFAHEGHGHTHGYTITHYFVEPEHLAVILGIFTAAFVYWKYFRKKTEDLE
jgi:hydrogenase/urease accessory protein HupE